MRRFIHPKTDNQIKIYVYTSEISAPALQNVGNPCQYWVLKGEHNLGVSAPSATSTTRSDYL